MKQVTLQTEGHQLNVKFAKLQLGTITGFMNQIQFLPTDR
jgi:hypothetical protein